MVRKFLQYCCVVVGLGCASTVQAVPITFDLIDSGGIVNSISYTVDTVTVVATPLTSVGTAQISPEATGLGVRTGAPKDHTRKIDQAGAIETLRLTFEQSVELHSVVFGQVGLDDDFALAIDGTTFISSAPIPGGQVKGKGVVTVPFLSFPVLARTGAVFDFTAEPGDWGISRVFFVRSFSRPLGGGETARLLRRINHCEALQSGGSRPCSVGLYYGLRPAA